MTRSDDLDRVLASFFAGEAAAPAPEGLLELVTAATSVRRPRQAWSARLRASAGPMAPASPSFSRVIVIGLAILLALAAAAVVGSQLFPRPRTIIGVFEPTGALTNQTDFGAASARLEDGRVVLAGGFGYVTLFDPADGSFTTLRTPDLYSQAAIADAEDSALIFGQDIRRTDSPPGISVVRFDGRTGSTSPILASSTAFGGGSPGSVFIGLNDGRVLIVGQAISGPALGSVATLIYDPRVPSFAPGPASSAMRGAANAVGLGDGRVLLVEGYLSDAKPQGLAILDTVRGTIVPAGAIDARDGYTMTPLADGRVLIAGGFAESEGGSDQTVLDSAWLVDPRGPTVTVRQTGRLPEGRWRHGAALLQDGRVLLVGGDLAPYTPFAPTASTLFFRPATNDFVAGPSMVMARIEPKVVPLADGRILVAGHYGMMADAPTTGAELTAEIFR